MQTLTETRAETIDHSATELRRIERDLHDGAQARLVALGLSLGMAEEMWARDPEGAQQILREARAAGCAISKKVDGVHVLDRGDFDPEAEEYQIVASIAGG